MFRGAQCDDKQNALWESSTQSIAFNDMQLSFRYIYLFVAIVLLVVWLVMMRRLEFSQWPFEQRGVLFLLIGLVFFVTGPSKC